MNNKPFRPIYFSLSDYYQDDDYNVIIKQIKLAYEERVKQVNAMMANMGIDKDEPKKEDDPIIL
jgi:hypothetical protein